jgi:ribosomal subunit interface protein
VRAKLAEVSPVQVPLQITFRGMPHSDSLEAHVRRRAGKLDRYYGRITSCKVVVELAHRHHQHAKQYRVSIDVSLPRGELATTHAPADDPRFEDAHAAVDDAFDDANRRLEDWAERMRDH